MFDWGDGTFSEWIGPYPSGTLICGSHTWLDPGPITIKAKGKDENGNEGDWSAGLDITVGFGCIPGPCFLAGTKILMKDGSHKNIEEIQINDMVLSYDEETKTLQSDRVKMIYHDTPDQMISDYYMIINDHLRVTPDHALYINNEWIPAGNLKIGDQLFIGRVNSLEMIKNRVPTYNFETDKYHTYLVVSGNDIIIAHNADKNYILGGHDEEVSYTRRTSATDNDYSALLDINKIFALSEKPYQEFKEDLRISDDYNCYVYIYNY
jgi:intein/homing endonuclease